MGVVEGEKVRDVTAALGALSSAAYPYPRFDALVASLSRLRPEIESLLPSATAYPVAEAALMSPVANPGKIMGAPVNYRAHLEEARSDPQLHHQNRIEEIHRIGLFLKATSSLIGPSEGVTLCFPDRRNDHEIELVAVIGKKGRGIPAAEALDYVAG